MVGLDAAGKTTILYKLKLGEIVTTIPTIGTYFPFPFTQCIPSLLLTPYPFNPLNTCIILTSRRIQRRNCRVQKH